MLVNEFSIKLSHINNEIKKAAKKVNRNFKDIKVIAVSKTKSAENIKLACNAGFKCFGENYVQELVSKQDMLNDFFINSSEINGLNFNLEWHFIGHLQSNKVKYIAPFIHTIHSCDSIKLANEISKQALKNERTINILLQVNTSGEKQKSGCEPSEAVSLVKDILSLENINLIGLMTIGTFTDDEFTQRKEFTLLRETIEKVNKELNIELKELSMGMTSDYQIAIEEGATFVRIGTAIFGER